MSDMRFTDRKANIHIHPNGKFRPRIRVTAGGNQGEHVMSTQENKHTRFTLDPLNATFMGEEKVRSWCSQEYFSAEH